MSKHNFTSIRPTKERNELLATICAHLALDPRKHSARLNAIDYALRKAAREIKENENMNVYQALDNNGDLVALTTSKATAIRLADSHYKDTAKLPILGDEYPATTPVTNAKGKVVGQLSEFV